MPGNGLSAAEHEAIVLALGHRSVFVRRSEQNGDHVARRRLALDRMPARLLLAHLLDLLAHLLVGDFAPTVAQTRNPCVRPNAISGRTSTCSSNVSGSPSLNFRS